MPLSITRNLEVISVIRDSARLARKDQACHKYTPLKSNLQKSKPFTTSSTRDTNAISKDYNAFISRSEPEIPENAAAESDRLVEGRKRRRRPFAVKDNIATQNYPTTCASKFLRDYNSPFEATVVRQLRYPAKTTTRRRKALMGKTNLDEFGMGSHSMNSFFGPVLGMEPLRKHSVGGSSGGSAMVVVTEECDYALGTDTGGSVRLPAAYTGTVGFKPSYGRISRWGVVPYANSLDTVGVLGKSIENVIAALPREVMDSESSDPTSLGRKCLDRIFHERKALNIQASRYSQKGPAGSWRAATEHYLQSDLHRLKIGIPVEYNIAELDPAVREEWQHALELFQEVGCTLVPISLPHTKHALSAYYVIAAAEASSNLAKYDGIRYGTRSGSSDGKGGVLYSKTRGEGFGDEVKRRILLGSYSLSSNAIDNYFIKAQKVRRLVQRDFDRVFSFPNFLRDQEQFDLSDMDESVQMEDKKGPPQVDFIVCPTAPTLPPTRTSVQEQSPLESYMNDVFTVPSSLAGLPAISVPFKLPNGKPDFAGIQIIGQFSDDFRLLLAATALTKLRKRKASFSQKLPAKSKEKHTSKKGPNISRLNTRGPLRKEPLIRKIPTFKGESRVREPRTAKEVDRYVEGLARTWKA